MGSPAEDLDAVLQVLKSRGLEADVVVVGPVTVQLRRTSPQLPLPVADDTPIERRNDAERAEFERILFASSRSPGS